MNTFLFPNKPPEINRNEIAQFQTGVRGIVGKEKYTCKYCGAVSDVPPSEQTPPVDYCWPEDHIEGD